MLGRINYDECTLHQNYLKANSSVEVSGGQSWGGLQAGMLHDICTCDSGAAGKRSGECSLTVSGGSGASGVSDMAVTTGTRSRTTLSPWQQPCIVAAHAVTIYYATQGVYQ